MTRQIQLLAIAIIFVAFMDDTIADSSERLRIIISDHHMGVGKDLNDNWKAEEDFRWADEFSQFLEKMHILGKGKTDIIIAGDFLELWQSEGNDCIHDLDGDGVVDGEENEYGCTQAEAVVRAQKVIMQHQKTLDDIRSFAEKDDNFIYVIPGNHDAALLFPKVSKLLLEKIGAPSTKVLIAMEGGWQSPDGLIYVEHGQQIPDDVNSWDEWPAPFLTNPSSNELHLRRPWGEQFVQNYYNQWEKQFPIIDNIAKETEGICYGVAATKFNETTRAVWDFLEFFITETSWDQFVQFLETDSEAKIEWDIDDIRENGDVFFVNSLPTNHPLYEATQQAYDADRLPVTVDKNKTEETLANGNKRKLISDENINKICNRRAAQYAFSKENSIPEIVNVCSKKDSALMATVGQLIRDDADRLQFRLNEIDKMLQNEGQSPQHLKIFAYGHTHKAKDGWKPFPFTSDWKPRVYNSGAWQRVITPQELATLRELKGLRKDNILIELEPDDLPPKYSYVAIPPYGNNDPKALLCWWQQANDNSWYVHGQECPGEDYDKIPKWNPNLLNQESVLLCGNIDEHPKYDNSR